MCRAGFGQEQCAGWKVERCQAHPPGNRGAARSPAEPTGNHQMKHEEYLALELQHDALAQATELLDATSLDLR